MSFRSKDHSSVGSVSTTQQSIDVPSKADSTSSKRLHSSTRDVVDSETLSIAESSVDPEPENPTNPTPAEPPQDVRTKPLGWLRQMFSRKSTLKDLEARRPDQTDLDSVPAAVPPEAVQRSPGRKHVKQWIGHAFSYSPYLRSRRNIYRPSTKPSTKRSFFRGPRVVSSSVDPPEIGKSLYGDQQVMCPPCPLSTREILVIGAVVVIIILFIIAFAIIGNMQSTTQEMEKKIDKVEKENSELQKYIRKLQDDNEAQAHALKMHENITEIGQKSLQTKLERLEESMDKLTEELRASRKSEVFTGLLTETQLVKENRYVLFDTVLIASKNTKYYSNTGELKITVKGSYLLYLNVEIDTKNTSVNDFNLQLVDEAGGHIGDSATYTNPLKAHRNLNDGDKIYVKASHDMNLTQWTSFSVRLRHPLE